MSRTRLNLAIPTSTASASGSAPPDSEVPDPRGTTFTPSAWHHANIRETCSVVSGSTTTIGGWRYAVSRSEEHTSELQSLMRISYAVFCLKNKQIDNTIQPLRHAQSLYP